MLVAWVESAAAIMLKIECEPAEAEFSCSLDEFQADICGDDLSERSLVYFQAHTVAMMSGAGFDKTELVQKLLHFLDLL